MKSGKVTQQFIDEAMDSLDGIQRAEAPPFFYTRLQAKLERQAETPGLWALKPAFSFAVVLLLVVLNIAAIGSYLKKGNTSATQSTGIQAFAQEYDMNASYAYNDKVSQ